MNTQSKTRSLVVTAMLSAVAFVLMFIEFSLPIMPSFIKLDISDLPALLGAFALGPIYGAVIELLKNLLHILIKGTSTGFVGELSNFLLGAVFAVVAGLIYKHKKTRSGAIIAAVAGAFAMGVICLPSNYYVVYPAYAKLMPLDVIIGMYEKILGSIATAPTGDSLFNCLLVFNVPFTFFKGILDALLCMLIYKPLSPILHGRV